MADQRPVRLNDAIHRWTSGAAITLVIVACLLILAATAFFGTGRSERGCEADQRLWDALQHQAVQDARRDPHGIVETRRLAGPRPNCSS